MDPQIGYHVVFPDSSISLDFTLYDYQGGSRRTWFLQNIGGDFESPFEAFGANNHQGFLAYSKDSSGNIYDLTYFAVVRTNKMLVVQFGASQSDQNMEKFKSFLSTLQIIEPNLQNVDRNDQEKLETLRWSEKRKTVWESADLGLRVTAPEWIEWRVTQNKKEDGSFEYLQWTRNIPEAIVTQDRVQITGLPFGVTNLSLLAPSYNNQSFNEVANSILPGAGYCSQSWRNSKSECGEIHPDYCYTKDEVVQSLLLKQTASFGPYTGQLRSIGADFNYERDCRAEDEWLIKAKNGRFVVSSILDIDEPIRLEGF